MHEKLCSQHETVISDPRRNLRLDMYANIVLSLKFKENTISILFTAYIYCRNTYQQGSKF